MAIKLQYEDDSANLIFQLHKAETARHPPYIELPVTIMTQKLRETLATEKCQFTDGLREHIGGELSSQARPSWSRIIEDEYLEVLSAHPDQDMSDVVHYLSSRLEDSVDAFVGAVGSSIWRIQHGGLAWRHRSSSGVETRCECQSGCIDS